MASWCPSISEAMSELDRDIPRYLSCVETIRQECGHDPQWSNAGEFIPEPSLTVPSSWERRKPVKSFMPDDSHTPKRVNTQEEDEA